MCFQMQLDVEIGVFLQKLIIGKQDSKNVTSLIGFKCKTRNLSFENYILFSYLCV